MKEKRRNVGCIMRSGGGGGGNENGVEHGSAEMRSVGPSWAKAVL